MVRSSFALLLALGLAACSVGERRLDRLTDGGGASDTDGSSTPPPTRVDAGPCVPSPEGTAETCSDGIDNDCDLRWDCSDTDCSGVGSCPVCGEVETPLSSPLALPDGEGDLDCSSDADCPGDQRCFTIEGLFGPSNECRESYRSTLSFIGFGDATFDSVDDINSLCVVMEHSYLRDIEITLEAPNGAQVQLQRFLGQEGGEIYLGNANDCDDDSTPTPGTGARYCWSPSATNPSMLDYADGGGALDSTPKCTSGDADVMPPGDYAAADDWSNLIGAPLNGDWTLSITDLWPIDNGYLFEWSISFDPATVEDCSSPLI